MTLIDRLMDEGERNNKAFRFLLARHNQAESKDRRDQLWGYIQTLKKLSDQSTRLLCAEIRATAARGR